MILKTGENLGFQKEQQSHVRNLNWYVTCTPNITYTSTMSRVPVHQK